MKLEKEELDFQRSKARIGIARALYKDPPIIIFDEATSAIDINNEKEIFQKFLIKKIRQPLL